MLYVCLADPGRSDPVCAFLDNHRALLVGARKIIVDPTNPYGYAHLAPPKPHESALTFHAEYLGDPSTSWACAYKNIMWTSIEQYRLQPTEICGDAEARAVLSDLVRAHGFEPVDCGAIDNAPLLEPRGPRRRKHPRIVQYDQTGK